MRVYKRVAALPSETVGRDLLVVDAERDLFFSSNPVGALIWTKLASPMTIEDLSQSVVEEFKGADQAEVTSDVKEFVETMHEQGIVEVVDGNSA